MCEHHEGCAGIDAALANIHDQVEQGYWGVIGVPDAEVPFCYSVGLHKQGKPELIIIGALNPMALMGLINGAGEMLVKENMDRFEVGIPYLGMANLPMGVVNLSEEAKHEYMVQAYNYYDNWDFEAQQLVWSDHKGLLPWQPGNEFEEGECFYDKQPIFEKV